jgi:hypothetical protein
LERNSFLEREAIKNRNSSRKRRREVGEADVSDDEPVPPSTKEIEDVEKMKMMQDFVETGKKIAKGIEDQAKIERERLALLRQQQYKQTKKDLWDVDRDNEEFKRDYLAALKKPLSDFYEDSGV